MCTTLNCNDKLRTFRDRASWIKHEAKHRNLETPTRTCPLCPPSRGSVPSETYYRHVGHHLREISLAVLPQYHDSEDTDMLGSSQSDAGQLSNEDAEMADAMSVDQPEKDQFPSLPEPEPNPSRSADPIPATNDVPGKTTQPCRYKTGKTLGAGEYSVTKECMHIETGHYYAAKVINKSLMTGREHMVGSSAFKL